VARRRWPAVRFDVRPVAVQGPLAVQQVGDALRALDREPEVDVVVVARGGGSVEDLLPFSDESLVRLVADLSTPLVSAIGHEPDTPLLDLVADVRASTPTDAARRVVPDVAEEVARVAGLRDRGRRAQLARLAAEERGLAALRERPALAEPARLLDRHEERLHGLRDRARRCAGAALQRGQADLDAARGRVAALSPRGVLARGYAVVQRGDGAVVRDPAEVTAGEDLVVRVAGGRFGVAVTAAGGAVTPAGGPP